jgi:hypothetical protein
MMTIQDFLKIFQIWKQYKDDPELKLVFERAQWLLDVWAKDKASFLAFLDALKEAYEASIVSTPVIPAPESPNTGPGVIIHESNSWNYQELIVWDGIAIPTMMRHIVTGGWTDNELLYALFSTYGEHTWGEVAHAGELYAQSEKIKSWFWNWVNEIGKQLLSNPQSHVTIIVNDRNDAGGCYVFEPIRQQLLNQGVPERQISIGEVFYP